MSATKAKKNLIALLVVALLVPVLLSVPVSAAASYYLYNGVELPALPDWDKTLYPYAYIYKNVLGTSIMFNVGSTSYSYNGSSYVRAAHDSITWKYDSGTGAWASYSSGFSESSTMKTSLMIWVYTDIFDSTGAVYFAASAPVPVGGSSVPDFTVIQSWDSSQVYAYQEETSADVFSVSASASGWNASFQWFYGSSQGGTFMAMPAETLATFTPKTTAEYLGTSVYYCAVTLSDGSTGESKTVNSGYLTVQVTEVEPPATEPGGGGSGGGGGDDPGTSAPDYTEKLDNIENKLDDVQGAIEEVPEQITDGMQDIVDKEDQEAEQQGNEFVDQITGLVPNESQGFISALGSLVSALSYEGTDCVLPIPALVLPGLPGLFGEARFMEAQQVDLESMFNMMPSSVLLLVQSLCTVALIIYCFKELYATISYFFVLKGGET